MCYYYLLNIHWYIKLLQMCKFMCFINDMVFFSQVLRGSELDDDGLMDPPLQIMTKTSESEGSDEILFEPPPMFAR